MSNISADCFFHFTTSIENLSGILNSFFYSRYSYEKTLLNINSKSPEVDAAFPMLCFCDIPLSQIKKHVDTYGYYGLGMNKGWGIRKKLNPVVYVNQYSEIATSFSSIIDNFKNTYDQNKSSISIDLWRSIIIVSRFLKAYSSDYYHCGKLHKDYTFYDEREWRFSPELFLSEFAPLSKDEYANEQKRYELNAKLSQRDDAILKFEPDDISYIIVKNESERLLMIKILKECFGQRYNTETVETLMSKINSCERILKDN